MFLVNFKEEQGFSSDFNVQNNKSTLPSTITADDEINIGKVFTDIPRPHAPLDEAHNDFYGLPSNPLSIYHTGPSWPLPTGPEAWRVLKEARPVCTHKQLSCVWHKLGKKIYMYFDSIKLKWTSIDPVRFAEEKKEPGPLFLWIGVLPGTLSYDHAKALAVHCKEILLEFEVIDVEIAFRESIYTRYAGLQLLNHTFSTNPTLDMHIPFTPALGLQIASKAFPYIEGTGCLYLCEGSESDSIFLLTARHVVLPLSKYPNVLYYRDKNNKPRHNIIHLGSRAFQNALEAINKGIDHWDSMTDIHKRQLMTMEKYVKDKNSEEALTQKITKLRLVQAKASMKHVSEFQHDINNSWNRESQRILGYIIYTPPISVNTGDIMFTEDWALIKLDHEKINWNTFPGNVIYLGSVDKSYEFMRKMYPDDKTRANFQYPYSGLMRLRDFIKYDKLCHPTMLDANGEECFIVVKNGAATGVRLGRATGIESFVREYKDDAIHSTSMEIAVYAYSHSHRDGAFSAPGDSGSVVADANCRIVGMITGGAGQAGWTDVTYVSAYDFLNERIKKAFPHAHLFPGGHDFDL